MHSNRQVVFKKEGNSFIQGFGESKTVGDRDVFVDVTKVTYDPKSTFAKSENCIEHFADSNNTFSFDYNSFFKAIEGNSKLATTDWRQNNVKDKGVTLANVYVSKAFMPQTNFSDVRLGIGRSTDATAIKNCLVYAEENKDNKSPSPAEVTISGHPFKKFVSGDAGASNFYETTSYRGIVDGDCYAIEYTIHSTSLAAYSPDQGIKQFDHSKIQGEIEKIVKSFKFLVNSN
jgi:hypothetical protein